MTFSSSNSSRSNNPGRDRYKAFINVCKFQYLDYNCKNNKEYPHASLTRAMFNTLIQEKNIKLPSFVDFKAGKTIHYGANGFTTSDRSIDLNSTILFSSTSEPLEEMQDKRKELDRFQQLKNNFESKKTLSCNTSIDVSLIQAFGDEIIFDLPGFVAPADNSKQFIAQETPSNPQPEPRQNCKEIDNPSLDKSNSEVDKSYLEQSRDSSIPCLKDTSFNALELNKTVNVEDLNWHITKVSDWRSQGGKNQFKVHYKKVKKRSYRP